MTYDHKGAKTWTVLIYVIYVFAFLFSFTIQALHIINKNLPHQDAIHLRCRNEREEMVKKENTCIGDVKL